LFHYRRPCLFSPLQIRSLSLPFSLPQMSTSGFVARGGPASSSSSSTSLMQQPLLRNRHGSSRRAAADARSSMRTTNRVAAFAAAAAPLNPTASAGVVACSLVSVPGPRAQARREAAVAKVQQRKVRKRVFVQAKVRLPRKKRKQRSKKPKRSLSPALSLKLVALFQTFNLFFLSFSFTAVLSLSPGLRRLHARRVLRGRSRTFPVPCDNRRI